MTAESPILTFEELYAHRHSLLTVCRRALREHQAEAEDAVHDAIEKAYRAREQFNRSAPLLPWLAKIAWRHAERIADRLDRHCSLSTRPVPILDDVDLEVEPRFRAWVVTEGLQALPERYRELLYLRHVANWSYADLAARYNTTTDAVASRLVRARKALRKEVTARAEERRLWPLPAGVPILGWARRARDRIAAEFRTRSADIASRFGVTEFAEALIAHPALTHATIAVLATAGAIIPTATAASAGAPIDIGADLTFSRTAFVDATTPTPATSLDLGVGNADGIPRPAPGRWDGAPDSNQAPVSKASAAATTTPAVDRNTSVVAPSDIDEDAASRAVDSHRPAIALEGSPSFEPNSDEGGTTYRANADSPSLSIDPGLGDPSTDTEVDPGPTNITPCPEPDSRGLVKGLVCQALDEPFPSSPPVTNAPTDDLTTTTVDTTTADALTRL